MDSAISVGRFPDASPRFLARMAGLLELLTVLGGIFAQGFVAERLIVFGDAGATAANILAHEGLYRLGYSVYLVEMACEVGSTVLLYLLLKPVSRSVSLLAAVLGLTGCVIKTFSRLFFLAPLFVLGGAHYLTVFNTDQLQALALLLLKVNSQGAGIALAFFGWAGLLHGYLIIRSTFLPRFLGVLSLLGGLGLLTYLSPSLGGRVFLYVMPIALVGAAAHIFWLLVFGVHEQRWKDQAAAASASIWR